MLPVGRFTPSIDPLMKHMRPCLCHVRAYMPLAGPFVVQFIHPCTNVVPCMNLFFLGSPGRMHAHQMYAQAQLRMHAVQVAVAFTSKKKKGSGCFNRQCMYIHPTAACACPINPPSDRMHPLSRILDSLYLVSMHTYLAPASQTARHVLPYVAALHAPSHRQPNFYLFFQGEREFYFKGVELQFRGKTFSR